MMAPRGEGGKFLVRALSKPGGPADVPRQSAVAPGSPGTLLMHEVQRSGGAEMSSAPHYTGAHHGCKQPAPARRRL